MSDQKSSMGELQDPGEASHPSSPVLKLTLQAHYHDFRRYLIRRVGDQATAEDILQSFCIRVMQRGTQLRNENSAICETEYRDCFWERDCTDASLTENGGI